MHSCRPQGATLRKVRSLKHTEIRPLDDISYVIKSGLLQARCNSDDPKEQQMYWIEEIKEPF